MDLSHRVSTTFTLQSDTCAWIALNERRQTWSAEVLVRVHGGIRYRDLDYGHEQPTLQRLRQDALSGGFFSRRPFQLGAAVDPTMTHCVLALLERFCTSRGIDPRLLLERAYPAELFRVEQDFREIRALADWEGTLYPKDWDALTVSELTSALGVICYEEVADMIEVMMERGN